MSQNEVKNYQVSQSSTYASPASKGIGAQEGAHLAYTLSFLCLSGIAFVKYGEQSCEGVALGLVVNLVFFGLIVWAVYLFASLLTTILPQCASYQHSAAFRFAHAIFAIFMLVVFVLANFLYFDDGFQACGKTAPVPVFFTTVFITIGYIILIIFAFSLLSSVFKRFSKRGYDEAEQIEEL